MDRSVPFKVLDEFGGLCTLMRPGDLPAELSPLAENVEFFPGGIRTRRGLARLRMGDSNAAGRICHIMSFWGEPRNSGPTGINIAGIADPNYGLWIYSGSGAIYGAMGFPYTTNTFTMGPADGTWFRMSSTTLNKRAYFALNDGQSGWGPAFQYDGTYPRMVAPEGPGEGPRMVESANASTAPLASGNRYSICVFVTSEGYWTNASYLQNATAHSPTSGGAFAGTGNFKINFSNIPTAPNPSTGYGLSNVIARKIFITIAGGSQYAGPYYCIESKMTINDNSTTTLSDIDFTEAELIAGTRFDDPDFDLSQRENVAWPAAFATHGNRLVAVGPLNAKNNTVQDTATGQTYYTVSNMSFQGGFCDAGARFAGWGTPGTDGGFGPGGAPGLGSRTLHTQYAIAPSGVAPAPGTYGTMTNRGSVYNLCFDGSTGGCWVVGRARLRAASGTGLSDQTKGHYVRFCATSGTSASRLYTKYLSTSWRGFAVRLSDGAGLMTNVTPEIALVVVGSAISQFDAVEIQELYIVPDGYPFRRNTMMVSAANGPEEFNAITSDVTILSGDGQMRGAFSLRDSLYVAKDRSLWAVSNTEYEPAYWTVAPVSDNVGVQSYQGVAHTEGYAILSGADGAYLFTGGPPEKISQEIQPTWDSFNKVYSSLSQVAIDPSSKLVYFLVYGTTKLELYVLNYVDGFGDPIRGGGAGRKWSRWFSETSTGTVLQFTALGRQYVSAGTVGDSRTYSMCIGNNDGDVGGNHGWYGHYVKDDRYYDEDPYDSSVYVTTWVPWP